MDSSIIGISKLPKNAKERWEGILDSPEAFEKHMNDPDKAVILRRNGYTADSIEYRYNNFGFRTDDDFDLKSPAPGTMFLGCSYTFGTGLNIEDTWAYKLNQKLGGECFYNFSQPGSGIETAYRMLRAYADDLKIKTVYFLTLDNGQRREFFHINRRHFNFIGPWDYDKYEFVAENMTDNVELNMSRTRTTDAIKGFCWERGIDVYCLNIGVLQIAKKLAIKNEWYARDLMHFGREYQDYLIADMSKWRLIT